MNIDLDAIRAAAEGDGGEVVGVTRRWLALVAGAIEAGEAAVTRVAAIELLMRPDQKPAR